MGKRQLTPEMVNRVNRLHEIIQESLSIIRTTSNNKTEQSRIDVALTKIIELKGIVQVYRGIETDNLELIEWQLTKAKYKYLKEKFGE